MWGNLSRTARLVPVLHPVWGLIGDEAKQAEKSARVAAWQPRRPVAGW